MPTPNPRVTTENQSRSLRRLSKPNSPVYDAVYMQHRRKKRNLYQSPPSNVSDPEIAGGSSPESEAETSNGKWNNGSPITFTYQWLIDDVVIPLATAKTILILLAWVGKTLKCAVTATNRFGLTVVVSTSIVITL